MMKRKQLFVGANLVFAPRWANLVFAPRWANLVFAPRWAITRIAPTLIFLAFFLFGVKTFAYQPAVVSAHPLASKAGLEVLKKGGSAADAAVAVAFALSVVEPYNSGIGGGGFLLYYEAKKKQVHFVDYRETSPSKTDPRFFAKNPRSLKQGIFSVAVPGFLKGMETIHHKWRKISWPAVLQPAIDLANRGVALQGRLAEKISKSSALLSSNPEAARLYLTPYKRGEGKISQQDLAKTYENIKTGGAGVFYGGNLGEKLIGVMELKGGWMTAEDLRNYRVYFRRPHQFDYKAYALYSSPLPSSGGNGLNLLFNRAIINNLDQIPPYSAAAYQMILEALKDYFDFRDIALGDSPQNIIGQTTHLCVIDAEGNIASMTNTLNESFGSGIVIPGTGIVLNNEMGDFSLKKNTANRVKAGVRPLSSMAPSIILKQGKPVLVLGTPGGVTIPQNLFQVLYFAWEWNMPVSEAVRQPKIYYASQSREVLVEEKMPKKITEPLLLKRKHKFFPSIGNIQALIIRDEHETIPISDKRGEGKGYTLRVHKAR